MARTARSSVLSEISKQGQPTRTAVLAQVTEQTPEVIDTAMARLGGEVMRRPTVHVEQEIAAAQEAQRKATREARKERNARVEQTTGDAHARVDQLKSKLPRPKARAFLVRDQLADAAAVGIVRRGLHLTRRSRDAKRSAAKV